MTLDHDTDFDLLSPLDEHPGPARRITSARAGAMVDSAIAAAATRQAAATASPPPRGWLRTAMIAAVIALFGGAASASVYIITTRPAPPPTEQSRGVDPAPAPPERSPRAAPKAEPILIIEEESAPPDLEESAPPEPGRRARRATAKPEPESPEDLLRLANERRRDKQWRAADRIYRKVIERERGGHAAYVATLASASIHLDHLGDARTALRLYRGSLHRAPRGPLAEEARWGVAEAQRALGNTGAEAAALRELIDRHPRSALLDRARARLSTLETALDPAAPR